MVASQYEFIPAGASGRRCFFPNRDKLSWHNANEMGINSFAISPVPRQDHSLNFQLRYFNTGNKKIGAANTCKLAVNDIRLKMSVSVVLLLRRSFEN